MPSFFPNVFFYVLLLAMIVTMTATAFDRSFNLNYQTIWGGDHFKLVQAGDDQVQLVLDKNSGAGFKSKSNFQSGRFHIKMKLPKQKTGGIVPNFYLISQNNGKAHSELDFEFVGTEGKLQTNVFASDIGGREQTFQLWFDPSEDFHSYTILWNQHQIVFFVDDSPIRVYKNLTAKGAKFPTEAMHIEATVWDGSSASGGNWAGKIDWALGPFVTSYQNFALAACPADTSPSGKCNSPALEWNKEENWDLNRSQKQKLEDNRSKHMTYDYCKEPGITTNYPECSVAGI